MKTAITSGVEIDSLTATDLAERYGIDRSNVYNRIRGLKELGYEMEGEEQGNKKIFNADQIRVMDALHRYLNSGNHAIASFLPASQYNSQTTRQDDRTTRQVNQQSYETVEQDRANPPEPENWEPSYIGQVNQQESYKPQDNSQVSYTGQDNPQESYKPQDTWQGLKLPGLFTIDLVELFLQKVSAIFPPPLSPADRGLELVYLRELEEAYEKGWQLTTNNVANLLRLKASTISGYGQQFEDAGFIFTRVGKRKGGQLAWLVRKAPRPTELLD